MSDDRSDPNAPIDAEYELAETDAPEEAREETPPPPEKRKTSGPGWLSFTLLLLIALSALGLGLWSSGLLQKGLQPTPEETGLAAIRDRQGEIAARLDGLEEQTASLGETVTALEQREPPAPTQQTASQNPPSDEALAALETRVAGLESRLETVSSNGIDPARLDQLEQAIANAGEGSGVAEGEIAALRQQVSALQEQLGQLQTAQSGLNEQLAALSQADTAIENRSARRTQAALALSAIEAAATSGEAFSADLARRLAASVDDPAASRLEALAGTPVPTLASLRRDFAKLKPDALTQVAPSADPGWLGALFGDTVSVRRSDPESPAAKQLAQAEAALGAGRLGEAISTVDALPEASRALFNAWLASARTRQQLDETLSALRLKLISERP